MNSQQPASVPN